MIKITITDQSVIVIFYNSMAHPEGFEPQLSDSKPKQDSFNQFLLFVNNFYKYIIFNLISLSYCI